MEPYVYVVIALTILVAIYLLSPSSPDVSIKSNVELSPSSEEKVVMVPVQVTTAASGFPVGQAINCKANDPYGGNSGGIGGGGHAIYRYMGDNTIRHYPSPTVAQSWDPSWRTPKTIDCDGLINGAGLELKA